MAFSSLESSRLCPPTLDIAALAAAAALFGSTGLVIDQHGDTANPHQLRLHRLQLAAVIEAGVGRKGRARGISLRLVRDDGDALNADGAHLGGDRRTARFARGDLVEAIYYPEAYHSFDAKVADRIVSGVGGKPHRLVYDAVAAPDAEARTRAFLAKYLR